MVAAAAAVVSYWGGCLPFWSLARSSWCVAPKTMRTLTIFTADFVDVFNNKVSHHQDNVSLDERNHFFLKNAII